MSQQDKSTYEVKIALKTSDGYFVRAINGGGDDVIADIIIMDSTAIFFLEWIDKEESKICLRTIYNCYFHAPGEGNVDAVKLKPLTSEIFTLEWVNQSEGTVRFKTRDKNYLHAVNGGGSNIDAIPKKSDNSSVFSLEYLK
jgi:hypothetical protein